MSIIILGTTMKAVAFECYPEINESVEKIVIFLRDYFPKSVKKLYINCYWSNR